jgi:CHAT domain-containing protein
MYRPLKVLSFVTFSLLFSLGFSLKLPVEFPSLLTEPQALSQTSANRKAEADRLRQQGQEQYDTSQFALAFQSWRQALAIYQEIKDRQGEGEAWGNMGMAHLNMGNYAEAIKNQRQWLAIAKSIPDRQSQRQALSNLGLIYLQLSNYTKAIDYHEQVLAIARELKDRRSEGKTLGYLGTAYDGLGDYAKAIEYHQQDLAIAREFKDRRGEGKALSNLGLVYFHLGDYTKAIEHQQQDLAIAREFKDRQGEGRVLGNLGMAYLNLGNPTQAIEYQKQWLAIAQSINDRESEGQALNNLGIALFKSGNLTAAEITLTDALKVKESLLESLQNNYSYKLSLFETQASTYRTLQQVLVAQNKTAAALEIAERGRARTFVELMGRRLIVGSELIAPRSFEQIKQTAKVHNSTLVQYSIIDDRFNVQGKTQSRESELFIWVIKPTGEVVFRKTDLKPLWQRQNTTLANLVTSSREAIGVRGRGLSVVAKVDGTSQAKQLQQLHQLLIQPIEDLLPTDPTARIVFIPQSSLFFVPFPALQDIAGRYLIEQHTILTAPAIQVLDLTYEQRKRWSGKSISIVDALLTAPRNESFEDLNLPEQQRQHEEGKDVLVVGNPTMPSIPASPGEHPEQLPSLPGAEREAKAIADLLDNKALIGDRATKAFVVRQMRRSRIIHLATHGLLDDFKGLGVPGAIALAPDGKDDGLLTASEILNLGLRAELVVLSACDTGRGKITSDGIIGLSRSLIVAGVPSVIVSLWAVPDAPTAALMTEFYRQLQLKPDKAQALRNAMLTTMKQNPNPKDWAAFTLIGESD